MSVRTILVGFLILPLMAPVTGCASAQYISNKSGLELQAIQRREFECPQKIAFAAAISVLQDQGYIINSADFDTGLISGKSPTQSGFFFSESDTQATAFIEPTPAGMVAIRLNFVERHQRGNAYGAERESTKPIEDAKYYQSFFEKIDEAIFIRLATE